jgi:hypothetical protein
MSVFIVISRTNRGECRTVRDDRCHSDNDIGRPDMHNNNRKALKRIRLLEGIVGLERKTAGPEPKRLSPAKPLGSRRLLSLGRAIALTYPVIHMALGRRPL